MNDYEYTFKQDSKEKKNIGNSARKMNRTGKGPIKFPSDYLTEGQKKKLSGPCTTYDMGRPMSYQDLVKMPEDLQRLYLQGVMDKFHPTQKALGDLFGVSKNIIAYKMKVLNVAAASDRGRKFNEKAWDAWIADGIIPETVEEVVEKSKEEPAEEKIEVVDAYLSKLSFGEKPKKFETKPDKKVDKIEKKVDKLEEKVELVKIPDNVVSTDKIEPPDPVVEKHEPLLPPLTRTISLDSVASMWTTYISNHILPLKSSDVAAMYAMVKLTDMLNNKRMSKDDWKELAELCRIAGGL